MFSDLFFFEIDNIKMCMMKSMEAIDISGTEYKNSHEKHVSKNFKLLQSPIS